MIVKDTKRNIQKLFQYKQNFDMMLKVSEIEQELDGAKIESNVFNINESEKLLKKYIKDKLNFSDDDYNNLFYPLEKLNAYAFQNEPYLRNVDLKEVKLNDISIKKIVYEENEFCFTNVYSQDENLLRKYSIGVFDGIVNTYGMYENDKLIATINPMEINIRANALRNVDKNVLVVGLGLGYFPYMASQKKDVNKITIIEENEDVIRIFKENILPFFENKEKIAIVHDDVTNYKKYISGHNFVVVDNLENNEIDQNLYKVLITYEDDFPNTKFFYSFEDCFLNDTIINIYQYFSAKLGTDDFQNYFKMIAGNVWNEMDKIHDTISIPDNMNRYLNKEFAKKIISKIWTKKREIISLFFYYWTFLNVSIILFTKKLKLNLSFKEFLYSL